MSCPCTGLGKASCWKIYALSRLNFWSICFLSGDWHIAPSDVSYFTCWNIHEVRCHWAHSIASQIFKVADPFVHFAVAELGKHGTSSQKQECSGFAKMVPHKGVRVGGQYGTRPSEKRRTRLLQNLNSQILFKQKQRRPRAGCTVLYPQIYVYQRDVIGLGFCEADRQCDQSNSGLFPGKGVGCPWSG